MCAFGRDGRNKVRAGCLFRKARNVPSVLNGGFKNVLDVDVGLFRKTYGSENIFDTRIQSGGTVVLGEEVLLRVLVNGDDGENSICVDNDNPGGNISLKISLKFSIPIDPISSELRSAEETALQLLSNSCISSVHAFFTES